MESLKKWMVAPPFPELPGLVFKKIAPGILAVMLIAVTCGCSITRYSDGSLSDYFHQPIPKLEHPLAPTVSLEVVEYLTSSNMKGMMISDVSASEIYILPARVGRKVEELLLLDEEFSEEATIAALNVIAEGRADARAVNGRSRFPEIPAASSGSSQYVAYHEQLASEAYANGDYLTGNIHNSAAANRIAIDASFSSAQATVGAAFAVWGALAAVGEAMIKKDFFNLRHWVETGSGAVGDEAPEDRHLVVFFFQFLDGKKFHIDSRMRVAVLLVLTDENGIVDMVLEGSDVLTCQKKCKLFTPKPTAQLMDHTTYSEEIQTDLWTVDGIKFLDRNGFDPVSGLYHYLMLHQGLQKLQGSMQGE